MVLPHSFFSPPGAVSALFGEHAIEELELRARAREPIHPGIDQSSNIFLPGCARNDLLFEFSYIFLEHVFYALTCSGHGS